jgi:hypothetical protein
MLATRAESPNLGSLTCAHRRSPPRTPVTSQAQKVGSGRSTISGALQRLRKVVQADARPTENTLERADNQIAVHRHSDAAISLGHSNMRAGLSGNREAQPLQGFDCFGS